MRYVDRPTPNKIADGRVIRPPRALVLHDTEASLISTLATFARPDSTSAHIVVDRDGTVYRLAGVEEATFHVRAADRWRPGWLTPNPDNLPVSDVNRQTLGAELVSDAVWRAAGEPYTTAQYQAIAAWTGEMEALYGPLPVVGHGWLQADRADPLLFDWDRFWNLTQGVAGLQGRILALEAELQEARRALVLMTVDRDQCNAIKAEFEQWIRHAEGRRLRVPRRLADELIVAAAGG